MRGRLWERKSTLLIEVLSKTERESLLDIQTEQDGEKHAQCPTVCDDPDSSLPIRAPDHVEKDATRSWNFELVFRSRAGDALLVFAPCFIDLRKSP